jgi:hypothetical protein
MRLKDLEISKCHPLINPKTGKIFDWENPEFIPGKNCATCRFGVLPNPKFEDFPYTCNNCILRVRKWKIRSDKAKRAAIKRQLKHK